MDLSLSSSSSSSGSYRECLRNHAASMGGRALDGCGEFMPAHPLSLACAACACHRNFHRRESSSASPPPPAPAPAVASPSPLAFLPLPLPFPPPPPARSQGPSRRKRCRTKFTADQKDRMWIFAEKLGWRIQKHHREELRDFCEEIGVESHALRVWMHNHKNSSILSSSSPGA